MEPRREGWVSSRLGEARREGWDRREEWESSRQGEDTWWGEAMGVREGEAEAVKNLSRPSLISSLSPPSEGGCCNRTMDFVDACFLFLLGLFFARCCSWGMAGSSGTASSASTWSPPPSAERAIFVRRSGAYSSELLSRTVDLGLSFLSCMDFRLERWGVVSGEDSDFWL